MEEYIKDRHTFIIMLHLFHSTQKRFNADQGAAALLFTHKPLPLLRRSMLQHVMCEIIIVHLETGDALNPLMMIIFSKSHTLV